MLVCAVRQPGKESVLSTQDTDWGSLVSSLLAPLPPHPQQPHPSFAPALSTALVCFGTEGHPVWPVTN